MAHSILIERQSLIQMKFQLRKNMLNIHQIESKDAELKRNNQNIFLYISIYISIYINIDNIDKNNICGLR